MLIGGVPSGPETPFYAFLRSYSASPFQVALRRVSKKILCTLVGYPSDAGSSKHRAFLSFQRRDSRTRRTRQDLRFCQEGDAVYIVSDMRELAAMSPDGRCSDPPDDARRGGAVMGLSTHRAHYLALSEGIAGAGGQTLQLIAVNWDKN